MAWRKNGKYEPFEEWIVNKTVIKVVVASIGMNILMDGLKPYLDNFLQNLGNLGSIVLGIFILAWAVKKERRRD